MGTRVASPTDLSDDRARPLTVSVDPLAESFGMLGLAVIGAVSVVCLMWLVT